MIPFLGSGASLVGRRPKQWVKSTGGCLPKANELAGHLAAMSGFPGYKPGRAASAPALSAAAQYFATTSAKARLTDELHEIFGGEVEPGPIHCYLAGIETPLLIVTTNWDDLIERAFAASGRAYDLLVHATDAATEPGTGQREQILLWRDGKTKEGPDVIHAQDYYELPAHAVIYKMHGSIGRLSRSHGQYVVTEDDYVDFLARMTRGAAIPHALAETFQTRDFLFLGYSLSDWNLRVVLHLVERERSRMGGRRTSWAIDAYPSALDTKLWSKRDVDIYPMTIDRFVEGMRSAEAADR